MDYWKEELYKCFLKEFPEYYKDSNADCFSSGNLPRKLSLYEQKILNDKIDIPNLVGCEKNYVLHELFKDKSKDNFIYYLLNTLELNCEVNSFDTNKNTVFIEIAKRYFKQERYYDNNLILTLFNRGYSIKEEDNQFLHLLYKQIDNQRDLERWTILRIATKLNDSKKFDIAMSHTRELFTMLSLKMGKPISFNFPNLLAVVINAIIYYRESGDIILKSIDKFHQTQKIQKLDQRKGTFKRKRLEYLENRPIQNKEFQNIAIELFPELH